MSNFAPWYRRNEYSLMREIFEDGETLPPNFDEWEANAENERETARLIPVSIEPEELDKSKLGLKPGNLYQAAVYAWNAFREGKTIAGVKYDTRKGLYHVAA